VTNVKLTYLVKELFDSDMTDVLLYWKAIEFVHYLQNLLETIDVVHNESITSGLLHGRNVFEGSFGVFERKQKG
jgi:hypothetical protein